MDKRSRADFVPLEFGDRIRRTHTGRAGTVMKVYADGSAAIRWDDGAPQPGGKAHERIPRHLIEVTAGQPAANLDIASLRLEELAALTALLSMEDAAAAFGRLDLIEQATIFGALESIVESARFALKTATGQTGEAHG